MARRKSTPKKSPDDTDLVPALRTALGTAEEALKALAVEARDAKPKSRRRKQPR